MQKWVYWLLTAAVAVTTGVYVYLYLDGLQNTVPVVVATADLPVYEVVVSSNVEVVQVRSRDRHQQAFTKPEEVVGLRAVEPVYKGEQLLPGRFTGDPGGGLSGALTDETRLLYLPTGPDNAAGGHIQRGDQVDIYHFTEELSGWGEARLLLSGLRVATTVSTAGLGQDQSETAGVLMQVSPEQAVLLVFAMETGELYLALTGHGAPAVYIPPVNPDTFALNYDGGIPRQEDPLPPEDTP